MKALSIRQPWAWAILHAGKDVENRNWPTRFRGTIAVHAAKGMTRDEYENARDFMIGDVGLNDMPLFGQCWRGVIVGLVDIVDCVTRSDSPWFEGKYGFVLANPRPLKTPISCKGALNFWDVPASVVTQIKEQLQ
jgi:hypothetical protein